MPGKKAGILLAVLVLGFVFVTQSLYTVDQTEKAIVLQLGKPVGGVMLPGLHFKKPFVQNVLFFDSRVLEYDARPEEILTKDKKNMIVDNFTKYRIVDPLQYYRTVRNERGALARLDDIVYAQLRVALGGYTLIEVVAEKRGQIMHEVSARASELVKDYGIEIVDVRIKRTDLPTENERAIFGRMRAERERQAKQYRSEGREESAKIKSNADKDRALILAEAERESAMLQGQGDGQATAIYAKALNQSPEFYAFKRSMEAYEKSLMGNTRVILTPKSEFFKYLR
ncbi:protease modulator HflC [Desulfovibrio ferrophilus]|uniref:Protein HflC n=1 Tax=Desulfovibrio ferrophilus TaxID=241368 RepID=A0A2Z6B098_9BACT|nr:protease modulator HflC [Desulfovibrio ferrophilus]BBD08883.1 HflC protein [Desulfovibrio ferrophilus]